MTVQVRGVRRSQRLQQLRDCHSHGLSTQICVALLRYTTGGDATFIARTTGIDTDTATKMDKIN